MSKKASKQTVLENVHLEKLVHGGQCLAYYEDKVVFVWGGLPGEIVDVRVIKKKSSYIEGVVEKVHKASSERVEPLEQEVYLSTSPWQIMSFDAENHAKQDILSETFDREGVQNLKWGSFIYKGKEQPEDAIHSQLPRDEKNLGSSHEVAYSYRNKMEFGFWGDDDGLHLAHYIRGTHGKRSVQGSALAKEYINQAARAVRDELNLLKIWGGDLKTLLLRANSQDELVGALFVKKQLDMSKLKLPKELKGLVIYFSEPKSPASVPTSELYTFGDISIKDSVMGRNITYDVLSFFQVNLPVFDRALETIHEVVSEHDSSRHIVDLYSGVGTIGLAVGADYLVESDDHNIKMALKNAKNTSVDSKNGVENAPKVVHASSEDALEYIDHSSIVIVDPPRAGLHKKVVERISEVKPPKVIYLSCNPITQARDVALLQNDYRVTYAQGFNFFPRTPHIESLIVLELK